jgi:hypothetical protein
MIRTVKIKILELATVLAGMISVGIFMQSCSSENENLLSVENEIVNSVELEDFIMADIEFQQAFSIFKKEIESIDLSKIKRTKTAEGKTVLYIPASICIEEKTSELNEKKRSLLAKFSQLSSSPIDIKRKYFEQSITNSVRISKKIIESGMNIHQPRLKGGAYESFSNSYDYCNYLSSYVAGSNYVEAVIIVFTDGTAIVYIDTQNTSAISYYPAGFLGYSNGNWYCSANSSPIAFIAHTHRYSGDPSIDDYDTDYPGLMQAVYYSGDFHYYQ